jgi:hypothetical protein
VKNMVVERKKSEMEVEKLDNEEDKEEEKEKVKWKKEKGGMEDEEKYEKDVYGPMNEEGRGRADGKEKE